MKLRLEILEDRNAPSDLAAMEPLPPPPTQGVVAVAYYPNFGTGSNYDTQLPVGNHYYFLGNPTVPNFAAPDPNVPPPNVNPLIPPTALLV